MLKKYGIKGYHQSPEERYNQPIYDFLSWRLLGFCVKEKKDDNHRNVARERMIPPLYFSCLISHFFYKKGGENEQGKNQSDMETNSDKEWQAYMSRIIMTPSIPHLSSLE